MEFEKCYSNLILKPHSYNTQKFEIQILQCIVIHVSQAILMLHTNPFFLQLSRAHLDQMIQSYYLTGQEIWVHPAGVGSPLSRFDFQQVS